MFITVINGKRTYKMSEIMRQAWVIFRTVKCSFSEALKNAWSRAKNVMREILAVEDQEAKTAKCIEEFKSIIRATESEEKIEEILDEALDVLDSHAYGKLLHFVYTII